jgi:hypothetical protein
MGQSAHLSQDVKEECYIDGRHNSLSQCLPLISLSLFFSLNVCCQSTLGCVCLCVPIGNLTVIIHPNVVDNLIPL